MKKQIRGVVLRRDDLGVQVELVCMCDCHDYPGIMHFRACCGTPKTDEGKTLLAAYIRDQELGVS
jgi:hypothetical protein